MAAFFYTYHFLLFDNARLWKIAIKYQLDIPLRYKIKYQDVVSFVHIDFIIRTIIIAYKSKFV